MKTQYIIVWLDPVNNEWIKTNLVENTHHKKEKAFKAASKVKKICSAIRYEVIKIESIFSPSL